MTMQATQRKTQSAGRAARLRFALQMAEQSQKVGDRIAYERERRELSRPALARELPGVATGNDVYRWEKGKHLPRADTMEALAKFFGISVADLYAGVPSGKPKSGDLSDALSAAEPGSLEKVEAMLREVLDQQATLLADLSEVRSVQERLTPLIERLGRGREDTGS